MDHAQNSWVFLIAAGVATYLYRLRPGVLFFAAAFPGTVAHELAHFAIALLTGGRPRRISLVPVRSGDYWTLGSISFYPRWWNGAFTALAPLLLLPIAWSLWRQAPSETISTQLYTGYIAGAALNSATPSRADWEIAFRYPIGLFVIMGFIAAAWNAAHP
ncbi:hypothetical protein F6X40_10765 [Paraburkholderia sp. UCT31]|uniref:M50 family metallopeptidase n=1 Tax=Paraburkholderia sp. UCT31 TaxID=2615209 RepID=UPI0016556F01|nr:M50 family metallopeptidase [Paraburkholderia sp. UCT31]MBC8737290.1 hypothetical protein [Paraburkholderia sp. UCT31]